MAATNQSQTDLEALAREHYCLSDRDGYEDPGKLVMVVEALREANVDPRPGTASSYPTVRQVPRLRARLDRVGEIREVVRKFLPEVQRDRRLLALSFTDPLRLAADELGIAVAPGVARYVRRALRGAVSFASPGSEEQRPLASVTNLRWVPKPSPGSDAAAALGGGSDGF